jgi:hypothetical protein
MTNQTEIKFYKVKSILYATEPDSLWCIKADNETSFRLFATDLSGNLFPLKDLTGSGGGAGITTLTSTDGSVTITGTATSKNLQVSSALQALISSAIQSGDPVSSLLNDAGYITISDIPAFVPSDYDLDQFTNLNADPFVRASELDPVHTNRSVLDQITEAFTTALKTAYDGAVTWIDTNGANVISAYTWVTTNGTNVLSHILNTSNPHSVTKAQIGLSDVPNIDTSTTTNITEGTKLFFTTSRVLATILSGLSTATGGTILDTDTVLIAFGKLQNQINAVPGLITTALATFKTDNFLDATSSIQGQINEKQTNFYKDASTSTAVTGVTANTILISRLIPANTFDVGTIAEVRCNIQRVGANGTATHRMYTNTSNSLTGAIQIATYNNTITQLLSPFKRLFAFKTGNVIFGASSISTLLSDEVVSTVAPSSNTFNPTVDNYIIVAVQPISNLDSFRSETFIIKGNK